MSQLLGALGAQVIMPWALAYYNTVSYLKKLDLVLGHLCVPKHMSITLKGKVVRFG